MHFFNLVPSCEITILYQFYAQKVLFKVPKICNINFWIEIDLPPLAVFWKFIRFGSQILPLAYWQGQANIGLGSADRALLKHFYSYLEAEMEFEVESNPKLLNGDWFHLYAIGSYHGSLQPSIQTNIKVKVRQIWKKIKNKS